MKNAVGELDKLELGAVWAAKSMNVKIIAVSQKLLGLVLGDGIAFTKEFGTSRGSSSSSREVGYSHRLNELRSKIKAQHSQSDDRYNITVSLKTKE